VRAAKPIRLIGYDFETTRINVGTPRPVYLTAFAPDFTFASPIRDMEHLCSVLVNEFLTEENRGCKFVAWNGNRFDAYFISAALLCDDTFIIRPYLTSTNNVRGLRITKKGDPEKAKGWEFLDGIAMLGLEGVTLEKLLANFAPEYRKLGELIDFETEEFDVHNPKHCEYAFRDSEGLYHAMQNAQSILLENFNAPLGVTMGGTCIKIFQSYLPRDIAISPLDYSCERTFREFVMRGGFCYCGRRYRGPIWKYDINQAYAAAMRESNLPCGTYFYRKSGKPTGTTYIANVEARNRFNIIPFYYRTEVNGRIKSCFDNNVIKSTWLTSIEIEQLISEGWQITWNDSYEWNESFTMQEYVDRLELLRTTCEGGPSGPIGTMVKAVGNHSYGKTVEQIPPLEFLICNEPPEVDDEDNQYSEYYDDNNNLMPNVWFRFQEQTTDKDYHAVHLGAFITASVRMKVRRAALLRPRSWLYADTDCVIFDSDVTALMDIDAKRYGAWKIEEQGAEYQIITKKVYTEIVKPMDKPKKRSAKGLNVKRLNGRDFDEWFNGSPPVQEQIQRQNFLMVMQGAEMFRRQVRRGTAV